MIDTTRWFGIVISCLIAAIAILTAALVYVLVKYPPPDEHPEGDET